MHNIDDLFAGYANYTSADDISNAEGDAPEYTPLITSTLVCGAVTVGSVVTVWAGC